jgi:hypothetical protein
VRYLFLLLMLIGRPDPPTGVEDTCEDQYEECLKMCTEDIEEYDYLTCVLECKEELDRCYCLP